MSTLFNGTVALSILIAVAIGVTACMRRGPAALRHWVLAMAIMCALAVPFVAAIAPSWRLPEAPGAVVTEQAAYRAAAPDGARLAGAPEIPRVSRFMAWSTLVLPVWIAGAAISLLLLLIGMMRLTWIASRSARVSDPRWVDLLQAASREHGVRRAVRLLQSSHPTLLVTWGLVRPKVILPTIAREWSDDRIRVVLSHELAHIVRWDWASQMLAELLRSIYWFNPLVWITCSRLRRESEHACDDAVLNLGIEGSEYATHLLDLARALKDHCGPWSPAPAMARPSTLERRIRAMLNRRHNRQGITPATRAVTSLALFAITMLTAGFAFGQSPFATVHGSVSDQTGGLIPGVRLALSNTQTKAKNEVRSNEAGYFEFVGLPAGDYRLEARMPGFDVLADDLTVGVGDNRQRNIVLQLGSIEETVTIVDNDSQPAGGLAPRPRLQGPRPTVGSCSTPTTGGCIAPPLKLKDVRPLYPLTLKNSGVEGAVSIEGVVSTNGSLQQLRIIKSDHPDLERPALDAVAEWQFVPTTLNGRLVETRISVLVNFKVQR